MKKIQIKIGNFIAKAELVSFFALLIFDWLLKMILTFRQLIKNAEWTTKFLGSTDSIANTKY